MLLSILKSKIHRAIVTNTHIDYEGSCAVDEYLLEKAKISEYEMLHIYNLNNGKRFTTYAIKAKRNTGIITLNGAAAHLAKKNDLVIICTYAQVQKEKVNEVSPTLVYLKEKTNIISEIKSNIKTQC